MGSWNFEDQNVESPEMCYLFKKTDFNTILACLRGKVYWWWWWEGGGVVEFYCQNRKGCNFIDADFL